MQHFLTLLFILLRVRSTLLLKGMLCVASATVSWLYASAICVRCANSMTLLWLLTRYHISIATRIAATKIRHTSAYDSHVLMLMCFVLLGPRVVAWPQLRSTCMPSQQLATSIKAPQEAVQGTTGKHKACRCLTEQKRELRRCLCTPLVDF